MTPLASKGQRAVVASRAFMVLVAAHGEVKAVRTSRGLGGKLPRGGQRSEWIEVVEIPRSLALEDVSRVMEEAGPIHTRPAASPNVRWPWVEVVAAMKVRDNQGAAATELWSWGDREVAELLGVRPRTVSWLRARGRLWPSWVGRDGQWYTGRVGLARGLARCKTPGPAPLGEGGKV